nr:glycosyltransferase family 4 protein [Lachnospiraceae bacterium]
KKKSAYLMHGCVEHENRINLCEDQAMNKTERETMALADRIYAVSDHFALWLKENYPEYAGKIRSRKNGMDIKADDAPSRTKRDRNMILAVGGGMPRKRIVNICRAVKELKKEEEYKDLRLIVIGDKGADSEKVDAFDFVDDKGIVSHDETVRLMEKAYLFVQNSCFETFGLAPLEALSHGCDLLFSKETGALEIFTGTDDRYIINDCEDTEEIGQKIRGLLRQGNNAALVSSVDKETVSWKNRTRELLQELMDLMNTQTG